MRHTGRDFPVPSVAHLKSGHYAALLRRDGARYLIDDPALGGQAWVREEALAEESSGVFVVPSELAPAGAAPLTPDEAATTWGRGFATLTDPRGSTVDNPHTPGSCPPNSFEPWELGVNWDLRSCVVVELTRSPRQYSANASSG